MSRLLSLSPFPLVALIASGCTSVDPFQWSDTWFDDPTSWEEHATVLEGELVGEMPDNGTFTRPVTEGRVHVSRDAEWLGFDLLAEDGSWVRMRAEVRLDVLGEGTPTRVDPDAFVASGSSGPEVVEHSPSDIEWIVSYTAPAQWLEVTRERLVIAGEPHWGLRLVAGFDDTDAPWDLVFADEHMIDARVVVPSLDPTERE